MLKKQEKKILLNRRKHPIQKKQKKIIKDLIAASPPFIDQRNCILIWKDSLFFFPFSLSVIFFFWEAQKSRREKIYIYFSLFCFSFSYSYSSLIPLIYILQQQPAIYIKIYYHSLLIFLFDWFYHDENYSPKKTSYKSEIGVSQL